MRLLVGMGWEDVDALCYEFLPGRRHGLRFGLVIRIRLINGACLLAGSVAAAYLCAILFGDALPGLKDGYSLSQGPDSTDLPNANLAFIAAVGVFLVSPVAKTWWTNRGFGYGQQFKWLGLTALVGAGLFAVSRLFV